MGQPRRRYQKKRGNEIRNKPGAGTDLTTRQRCQTYAKAGNRRGNGVKRAIRMEKFLVGRRDPET